MKRILQLVVIFSLAITFSSVVAQEKAKIVFEAMEYDFGTFNQSDGIQTTTFKFKNEGSAPLVLNAVRPSCGCTSPSWTNEPVIPGGDGEIQISYNPTGVVGSFNKTITVQSNAENATLILRIKGQVQEKEKTLAELYPRELGDLRVKTTAMSFSNLKNNEVKTNELELLNDTDSPVTVGFRTVPNHLSAKVEPETIPPHEIGKLIVTYNAADANTYGFASHRIYLSLNGSNDYKYSIGVSATIQEDFSELSASELANAPVANFGENSFDFGDMAQGEKKEHTFTLTNNGQRDLIIRNVRSSCGCTAVAPSKKVIAAGETAPIKVTFDSSGKRGRQSKTITVITNDPNTPTTTLRISSNVNVPES